MQRERYETAILCAYMVNTSGAVKIAKTPDDVYKKMRIKTVEEIEKEKEQIGERRFYKGSLSSQFQQHAEWLESQK